jgi:hypothetical protein
MYQGDNNDTLIPNAQPGIDADCWCPSGPEDWGLAQNNTNIAHYMITIMAPYMGNQLGVYKCPFDKIAAFNGPRIRSYSMNGCMGTVNAKNTYDPGFLSYVKGADLSCPTPSDAFVFCDENPMSINDGYLQINSAANGGWPDVPAGYHEPGCGFSFADGHSISHKWVTGALTTTVGPSGFVWDPPSKNSQAHAVGGANNEDWVWFQLHATCKDNGTPVLP